MVTAEERSGPSPACPVLAPASCCPGQGQSLRHGAGHSLHVLVLLVGQDFGRGLGIVEELADLFHMFLLDAVLPVDLGKEVGWGEQLH